MRPSEIRTFTPSQYEAYTKREPWMSDNFDSDSEYEGHWPKELSKFRTNSDAKFGPMKRRCKKLRELMENRTPANLDIPLKKSWAIAGEQLPLLRAEVLDHVALLCSNYPIMQYVSPQDAMNLYVAGLSQLKDVTLKQNLFSQMLFKCVYDACTFPYGVFSIKTDSGSRGPLGQREMVKIERVHPEHVYVDAKAKEYDWRCMSYLIIEHEMEIGEVRKRWPERGWLIPDDATFPPDHDMLQANVPSRNLIASVAYAEENTGMQRNTLNVKECWIKDSRLQFEAEYEDVVWTDKEGYIQTNRRLKVDADGYVVGKWIPAFPNGRCIITANDEFVLADFANPYTHGEAPYIFVVLEPSEDLTAMSFAEMLAVSIRKFNDLVMRGFRYAQTEVERPMILEAGAFPPANYDTARGNSAEVLQKFGGKEFGRMPPTPLPDFYFPFLQFFSQMTDKLSGTSGVMRGQVADGAQLSAQAMSSLQNFAASRVKMHAEFLSASIVRGGRQLLWVIRDSCDEPVELEVMDAFQKKIIPINWQADKATFTDPTTQEAVEIAAEEDYLVDIQPGTGMPGAEQSNNGLLLTLYDKKIIDDIAVLQGMRFGGWQEVVARKHDQEDRNRFIDSAGRAAGLEIKSDMKPNGKAGGLTKG